MLDWDKLLRSGTNCFLVSFPDFSGQRWRTHGDTYSEAVANGIEALESLVMAYQATGESLR